MRTFEDIEAMMRSVRYKEYGNHDLLVSLSCVFDCKSVHDGFEYQTEVIFAVPIDWLCDYMEKEHGSVWDFGMIQDWLKNEYTSEDSEPILGKAVLEHKIAFWKIC